MNINTAPQNIAILVYIKYISIVLNANLLDNILGIHPSEMTSNLLHLVRDATIGSKMSTHHPLFTHPFRDATIHILVASLARCGKRFCGQCLLPRVASLTGCSRSATIDNVCMPYNRQDVIGGHNVY